MRHLIATLCILLFSVVLHGSSNNTDIEIAGRLSLPAQRALSARDISHDFDGLVTTLRPNNKKQAVRALIQALKTNQTRQGLVRANLANAETTRTRDGFPYRRQFVVVAQDGSVEEIATDDSGFNWCYDPCHPDAMSEGSHAGYVAKPNVNREAEEASLERLEHEYRLLCELTIALDPAFVIPERVSFQVKDDRS